MRPEDFTAAAPGTLVSIPRPALEAVRAAIAGSEQPSNNLVAFLPDPLPPELSYDAALATSIGRAMLALGQLDAVLHDLPNPYLLVRPLLRREAVESSRIEGTIATLDELMVFEETGDADATSDVREVKNYVEALEHALAQPADRAVSVSLIRELHHILLRGVRGEDREPGVVRTRQNHIGRPNTGIDQARYVTPPPWLLDGLLADLERYIQGDHVDPPLIRIALVHYQFEAIHPFLDGNGRVGRLLIATLLRRWGVMEYPVVDLSAYIARHRTTYVDDLLRVSQQGDWRSWIDFFLTGVAHQGHDAARRSRALIDLRQHYRHKLRQESKAERLDMLIDHLFEHTAVTIRRASKLLDVTYPTAQRLIERLAALRILREATGKRRNRVYLATEVFDILNAEPL